MPDVLLVHRRLQPHGGHNAVGAWALQALARAGYDTVLLSAEPVDCEALNRVFGTSLKSADFTLRLMSGWWQTFVDKTPTPMTYLVKAAMYRYVRKIRQKDNFDIVIGTENEADLGAQPAIQYIHFPALFRQRPDIDLRWYHRIPGAVALYYWLADRLTGVSRVRMQENLTLVNSAYIGELAENSLGIHATVLHPPVPGDFPELSWNKRRRGVVCLGRIAPDKNTLLAIEVVARARALGVDLDLSIVGMSEGGEYMRRVEAKAREYSDWLSIHCDLTRADLLDLLVQHRFGLHVMEGEHFGIAVAELQRAGCITFAHNSGGPREILDCDDRVLFDEADDAARKLARIVNDTALRDEVLAAVELRRSRFSEQHFINAFLEHVNSLLEKRY